MIGEGFLGVGVGVMRRGGTVLNVLVVLAGIALLVAAIDFLRYGYSCFDALIIQPAVTSRLAQEAVDRVESGWIMEPPDGPQPGDDRHRYIFFKEGRRRDVNLNRDDQGKWSVVVTPIMNYP